MRQERCTAPRMVRGQMRDAADAGAEQQCTMLCRAAQGEGPWMEKGRQRIVS